MFQFLMFYLRRISIGASIPANAVTNSGEVVTNSGEVVTNG